MDPAPTNPSPDIQSAQPRVYLAGPEVFLADALGVAAAKKALCAEQGLMGVFPFDIEIKGADALAQLERARRISLNNESLMRSCDLVVANCTPFRGVAMDSGTAYEVGFMRALGRPVFGYSNVAGDYKTRALTWAALPTPPWETAAHAAEIEDFGMAENLMITVPMLEYGDGLVSGATAPGEEIGDLAAFRRCLAMARAWFARAPRP